MSVKYPRKIETLSGIVVKKLYAYENSLFALSENGEVYAWGNNQQHALGLDTWDTIIDTPTRVRGSIESISVEELFG